MNVPDGWETRVQFSLHEPKAPEPMLPSAARALSPPRVNVVVSRRQASNDSSAEELLKEVTAGVLQSVPGASTIDSGVNAFPII